MVFCSAQQRDFQKFPQKNRTAGIWGFQRSLLTITNKPMLITLFLLKRLLYSTKYFSISCRFFCNHLILRRKIFTQNPLATIAQRTLCEIFAEQIIVAAGFELQIRGSNFGLKEISLETYE
jgi:hypothetical protein